MRKSRVVALTVAALLVGGLGATAAAGAGGSAVAARGQAAVGPEPEPGTGEGEADYWLRARGVFAPPAGAGVRQAVTYDEDLVPAGARVRLSQRVAEGPHGGMMIELDVEGLPSGRTYGVHVHTEPCGVAPDAAGGHYQHAPGAEPWRTHQRNEVWLDLTTDDDGAGGARSRQNWVFRPAQARSVVLHEHATDTGEHGGTPGDAGDRVACLTVPFAGFGDGDTEGVREGPASPGTGVDTVAGSEGE